MTAPDIERAREVALALNERQRKAMRYYAMEYVSPKSDEKIRHPSNEGWSSKTIDDLLDLDLLIVGPGGWHIFSDFGRLVAHSLQDAQQTGAPHD